MIRKIKAVVQKVANTSWRVMRALDREFNAPKSYRLRSTGSSKVVVFVHGLLSESPRAWTCGETSWPELMVDDPDFNGWDVSVANWYSTVMSEDHSIEMAARRLFEDLTQELRDCREIAFVCHSLGGIVVRQMLLDHPELVREKIVRCISLGTPARGAKIATVLSSISRFFKHSQAQAVAFDSPSLLRIHASFQEFGHSHPSRIFGKEFVETTGLGKDLKLIRSAGRYGLRVPPLVGHSSQGGYFGEPIEVPDTDHTSISRPSSREAAVYVLVKSTILGEVSS